MVLFYQCFYDGVHGPAVLVTRSNMPVGRIEGNGSEDVRRAVKEVFDTENICFPAESSGIIKPEEFETMLAMGVPAFERTKDSGWMRCE